MKKIYANPRCACCCGTGVTFDSVPYGSTYVSMPAEVCECCLEWNVEEGNITWEEVDDNEFELVEVDPRYLEDVDSLPGGIDYY